jgi:hypothetical protein
MKLSEINIRRLERESPARSQTTATYLAWFAGSTTRRNVMNYVMNNWRHHREDQGFESMFWEVDYFSSGPSFDGWKEGRSSLPVGYEPLPTSVPQSWLLAVGWLRGGGAISMRAVPAKSCYEGR